MSKEIENIDTYHEGVLIDLLFDKTAWSSETNTEEYLCKKTFYKILICLIIVC